MVTFGGSTFFGLGGTTTAGVYNTSSNYFPESDVLIGVTVINT